MMNTALDSPRTSARKTEPTAWLLWRPASPSEPQQLSVAELAECRCPDLCDRDHDND